MKTLESDSRFVRVLGRCVLLSSAFLLCAAAAAPQQTSAYVRSEAQRFVLGNEYLERTVSLVNGHPATTQFENKLSGRSYAVGGDEFELDLIWERLGYEPGSQNPWRLTSSDFKVDGNRVEDAGNGAKRLIFSLSNRDREPALHVDLVYEIASGQPYTRQWLQLKTEGRGSLFVHYAAVQTNEFPGAKFELGGFGQPIYSNDLFWGLEYPSGLNRFHGSAVSLGSFVGLKVQPEGFTTAKAVTGVARSGEVQSAFFAYVKAIRARPVRPYVLYNTWYDLQRMVMTGQNTRQRAGELNDILQKKYRLKLDSFVLDDGWDNMHKLWRIDTTRFPNGFHDLAQTLKDMGSGLGVWFGPVGGYDQRSVRIATGRAMGMEIESNGDLFCLAGRHYSDYFEHTVLDMQKTYDINFLKLDGVPFGCNEPDHGHPTGIYSREADERVFLDLMSKLRQQKPDVFLNITTGIWLSPWWLQYADTVWMGGEDSGYLSSLPTLSPRQSALSYRDSVLYDDFVRNRLQFPMSSIMTHGIIRGKFNLLGGEKESISDWRDEVVHYVSVGNMMTELYITPELLDTQEWDVLAATLHWAEANQHPLLDDSTMVLGDPARREPYGFVHASRDKIIITLRNPFAEPRSASLRLDHSSGIEPSAVKYRLVTIYPFHADEPGEYAYRDSIHTRLGAFEERVLELVPETDAGLRIAGARYSIESAGNANATVHLYAPAGSHRSIEVNQRRFDLDFGKSGQQAANVMASAPAVETGPGNETRVRLRMQIPEDVPQTTVALLFEPEGQPTNIDVTATDNGSNAPLRTENGKGVWQWFALTLHPGAHELHFALQLPPSLAKGGKLSLWAISQRRLAERTITVPLHSGTSDLDALPVDNSIEKTTIPLLETTIQ